MRGRLDAASAGLCGPRDRVSMPHLITRPTLEPSGVFHFSVASVREAPPRVPSLDRSLGLLRFVCAKQQQLGRCGNPSRCLLLPVPGGSTRVVIATTLCIDTVQLPSPCGPLM